MSIEQLFAQVPLTDRLNHGGLSYTRGLTKAQRHVLQLQSSVGQTQPETRLKINSIGELSILFTEEMVITEEFVKKVKVDDTVVQIEAIRTENYSRAPPDFLENWIIRDVNANAIEIKLTFKKPLLISKGDDPDMLVIQLEIGELKTA